MSFRRLFPVDPITHSVLLSSAAILVSRLWENRVVGTTPYFVVVGAALVVVVIGLGLSRFHAKCYGGLLEWFAKRPWTLGALLLAGVGTWWIGTLSSQFETLSTAGLPILGRLALPALGTVSSRVRDPVSVRVAGVPASTSRLVAGGVAALLLVAFYAFPVGEVHETLTPEVPHARLEYLRAVIAASNQGYYGQVAPLIPADSVWEDPGLGLALSLRALLGRPLGLPAEDQDIHRIELFILLVVFAGPLAFLRLPLPGWFCWVVPPFILVAFARGLLFFSPSQQWASTAAAFWTAMTLVAGLHIVRSRCWPRKPWSVLLPLGLGLVAGGLGLLRRNTLLEFQASVACAGGAYLVLFLIRSRRAGEGVSGLSPRRRPRMIRGGLSLALVLGATLLPSMGVDFCWWVRDQCYAMKDVDRIGEHPAWAPIYLGLGFVDNEFGIRWDDGVGHRHVQRRYPEVEYATTAYEEALRELFLESVAKRPLLLFWNTVAKSLAIAEALLMPLSLLALLIGPLLVAGAAGHIPRLAAGCLVFTAASPVICFPAPITYLALHSHVLLWTGLTIAWLMSDVWLARARDVVGLPQTYVRGVGWWLIGGYAAAAAVGLLYLVFLNSDPMAATQGLPDKRGAFAWTSDPDVQDGFDTNIEFSPDNVLEFGVEIDGDWHEVLLDFPTEEPVTALRFEPAICTGVYELQVEEVRLERGEAPPTRFAFDDWGEVKRRWLTNFRGEAREGGELLLYAPHGGVFMRTVGLDPQRIDRIGLRYRMAYRPSFWAWLTLGLPYRNGR